MNRCHNSLFKPNNITTSAVAAGRGRGTVPPLWTACPPFWFTQNTFLKHHVTKRQQAKWKTEQ